MFRISSRRKTVRESIENSANMELAVKSANQKTAARGWHRKLSILTVMSMLIVGFQVIGSSTAEAAVYTTTTSSWTGNLRCNGWASFTIPTGATNVSFRLVGGGGAAGDNETYLGGTGRGGNGGRGGVVTGTLNNLAGQTVQARIGCGGTDQGGTTGAEGYIRGGYTQHSTGGGGGGASALCIGSSPNCSGGTVIAIAAGGGGGGAGAVNAGGSGHAGGAGGDASTGVVGSRNSGSTRAGANGGSGGNGGGGGGAGGAVNPPPNTTTPPPTAPTFGVGASGAVNNASGGAGGGGLLGGGGGGQGRRNCCSYYGAGGGGGGTSWAINDSRVSGVAFSAASTTNANCTTDNRATTVTGTNAGFGGTPGLAGCAGYVTITYTLHSTGIGWTQQPNGGTVGVPFAANRQPLVRAINAGSPTGGIQGENILLSSTGPLTCAGGLNRTTDANGYATFTGCSFSSAGTFTITATNTSRGGSITTPAFTIESINDWTGYDLPLTTSCGTYRSTALPTTSTNISVAASGGGGGGGGGGSNSAPGGNGANGARTVLSNASIPRTGLDLTQSNFNYIVGCRGGLGESNNNGANGGAGGQGFGAGGSASRIEGGNRQAAGGGGGGATGACLGTSSGSSCLIPLTVAAGGAGGGGSSYNTNGSRGHGGNIGSGGSGTVAWAGQSGTEYGGRGGERGRYAGGGGGGGGGVGGNTSSTNGGAGSGNGSVGTAGGTRPTGAGPQAAGNGSGHNGGRGGYHTANIRRKAGGGGGGGGFRGGGGGGGDEENSTSFIGGANGNPGAGGGGSGSSWINTSVGGTRTHSWNGGAAGGSGGSSDRAGHNGSNGTISASVSGEGVMLQGVDDRSTQVGAGAQTQSIPYRWHSLGGRLSSPVFTIDGAPSGWSISNSGVISGMAPTVAGTYTITVTARTTVIGSGLSSPVVGANMTNSISFNWTFNPGPPAQLFLTDQPANPSPVASDLLLGIQIQDQYGNHVPNATNSVSVTLSTNPTGAVLTGGDAVAAVGGIVEFPELNIDRTGFGYQLRATSGSLSVTTTSFDVVVFATDQVFLNFESTDPNLSVDGLQGSLPGAIDYYRCPGFRNSTPCPNPQLIGSSTTAGSSFELIWQSPPVGDYRILVVQRDNVGNETTLNVATTPSTPVRVTG